MSPLRRLLGQIGLAFALIVIVSPAVLFFVWMLSLSVKFEVDNASYEYPNGTRKCASHSL